MELIDLVNDLSQMVNFPTWVPDCYSQSPALLDLVLSSDANICSTNAFPRLRNSDHVVVSVSIDFLSNSKQDATFHQIAYDYSVLTGMVFVIIFLDVRWVDICKLGASAGEFYEWVQVEIDVYIPH